MRKRKEFQIMKQSKSKIDVLLKYGSFLISVIAVVIALISAQKTNLVDEKNLAVSPLVITYNQLSSEDKIQNVKVQDAASGDEKTIQLYPVQVKVRSGSVASVNTIISYFPDSGIPTVNVAADFKMQDKLKRMDESDVMLYSKYVMSFASNKDFSFNQSFLIHGTDGTYHLMMIWYNGKEQGVLDNIRSLDNTGGINPKEVVNQYNRLKEYLEEKKIIIS